MDLRVKRLLALLLFLLITASMLLAGCGTPQEATPELPPVPTPILVTPTSTVTITSSPTIMPTTTPKLEPKLPIPDFIIEKSNQYVISKVGSEYFSRYITFNPPKSRYFEAMKGSNISAYLRNSHFYMVYTFRIPDKPFVDELISFAVDVNGNVVNEPGGIPDRLKDPQEGEFPIDEREAIKIAMSEGLQAGIADWKTSFHWYAGDFKTYVWTVQNTLYESRFSANGRTVVIDANSGTVLGVFSWGRNFRSRKQVGSFRF
ncbi:MAG: hypothetical protein HYX79_10070 [Chloroflexi bacterium]|nr:hypothetical protein [Chloroflexota bacterium]